MRVLRDIALAVAACWMGMPSAHADPIINSFGLDNPVTTITFDEIIFAPEDPITTEYAAFGVEFEPLVFYDSQGFPRKFPGIAGHYVGNNGGGLINPFSIIFTAPQTDVAFGVATNLAITTFTALLAGAVIESFDAATDFDTPEQSFFGFDNILFDEIMVEVRGDQQILIDNIQMGIIPGPGALALLWVGGLVLARRRRD